MTQDKILGIDIGATKIHIGEVQNGNIVNERKFPTSAKAPKEQILQEIIEGIEAMISPEVAGIGIGVPGLIDDAAGIIYDVQNIASWQEVHLKEHLEGHFKKPVRISNDANTFVLGEKIYGKARPFKNVVGLTLGTGFGAGIIIDGKLYSGAYSSAGELGSIPYLDLTIEDYCSGKFFERLDQEGSAVYEQACNGHAHSLELFYEFGRHLGNTIKTVLFTYAPQAIFLGGSISQCYPFFRKGLEEAVQSFPFKRVLEQLVIAPSEMQNAAILGAAALIKERL